MGIFLAVLNTAPQRRSLQPQVLQVAEALAMGPLLRSARASAGGAGDEPTARLSRFLDAAAVASRSVARRSQQGYAAVVAASGSMAGLASGAEPGSSSDMGSAAMLVHAGASVGGTGGVGSSDSFDTPDGQAAGMAALAARGSHGGRQGGGVSKKNSFRFAPPAAPQGLASASLPTPVAFRPVPREGVPSFPSPWQTSDSGAMSPEEGGVPPRSMWVNSEGWPLIEEGDAQEGGSHEPNGSTAGMQADLPGVLIVSKQ